MYKQVLFNTLKKGQVFIHPETDEKMFITYRDNGVIGYGIAPNLTQHTVKETDELWKKQVDVPKGN